MQHIMSANTYTHKVINWIEIFKLELIGIITERI